MSSCARLSVVILRAIVDTEIIEATLNIAAILNLEWTSTFMWSIGNSIDPSC